MADHDAQSSKRHHIEQKWDSTLRQHSLYHVFNSVYIQCIQLCCYTEILSLISHKVYCDHNQACCDVRPRIRSIVILHFTMGRCTLSNFTVGLECLQKWVSKQYQDINNGPFYWPSESGAISDNHCSTSTSCVGNNMSLNIFKKSKEQTLACL